MIPSMPLNTGQASSGQPVPAPVGGLNGRDPLAKMSPTDAYLLDNAFPHAGYVESRQGCEKFSTETLGAPVQALEVYTGNPTNKLLAWAGGKIFDVTTGVPNQLATGLLGNLPVTAMFSNAGAQFLIIVNGVDQPRSYNGAALNLLVMTGVTGSPNTLNSVFAFKGRLFFGQRDMLGFYYAAPGAIQGALSYFDLAQVSKLGGKLIAIGAYSDGSGETPQDYIVFVTDKGECIVYGGTDPSNAATWGLVGRYYTAPPIGNRCIINYGSELVILTLDGAIGFSEIRRVGDSKSQGVMGAEYSAITSKLGGFLSASNINADVPGWQGTQYSSTDGWLLLNVPATTSIAGQYYQYVMNTTTNAWTRFTNWNGLCFTVFNRRLYFGRYDGFVMLGDEGRLDDGEPIRCDIKQAYNYFEDGSGLGNLQKHFQWASLQISCDGEPPLSGKFNVDFKEEQPDYLNALANSGGAEWDVALWDVGVWGDDARTQRFIITLNNSGLAGALWLRASLEGLTFRWYATQFVMEKMRGLLL